MSFKDFSLRTKIIVPLVIVCLFSSLITCFWIAHIVRKSFLTEARREVRNIKTQLHKEITQIRALGQLIAKNMASSVDLQFALALKDPELLKKLAGPLLKGLREQNLLQAEVIFLSREGRPIYSTHPGIKAFTSPMERRTYLLFDKRLFLEVEQPVSYNGEAAGKLALLIDLRSLFSSLKNTFSVDFAWLAKNGEQIKIGGETNSSLFKNLLKTKGELKDFTLTKGHYLLSVVPLESGRVAVALAYDLSGKLAAAKTIVFQLLGVLLVSTLVFLSLIFFISWKITEDITSLVKEITELAKKLDLSRRLPTKRRDEIGRLAQAFNHLLQETQRLIEKNQENVAFLGQTAQELEKTQEGLVQSASLVSNHTGEIAVASEQLSEEVNEVRYVISELKQAINEISTHTSQAQEIAGQAREGMGRLHQVIQVLEAGSQEIGEILQFISHIAEQTNLLALNATIEAARAGEAGKGFAVVANEVKELARQTAEATQDIAQKIHHIQEAINRAAKTVAESEGVIAQINDISTTIAAAVEEQAATAAGITEKVEAVSEEAQRLSQTVPDFERAVALLRESTERIQEMSKRLLEDTEKIRKELAQFKT